jgi:hypothetical protein
MRPKKRSVEPKKQDMPSENYQLRIEEKRAALELEKLLAGHHKALAALLKHPPIALTDEAESALQAAIWNIGVVVVQVVERSRSAPPATTSRA